MGADSAGGGGPGRGEKSTDSAKAKIKAATHGAEGLSLSSATIVQGVLSRGLFTARGLFTTIAS